MGRKRKQLDPGELSNLPPCRVCDAPGAGFHYGVNTCEACKGFFHRSLRIHDQYKCSNEGDCVIEHGKGKLCQLCRYHKCLAVGMAKEAIKTGRYTSVKRTNDILEIKRLQQSKDGKPEGQEWQNGTSQTLDLYKDESDSNHKAQSPFHTEHCEAPQSSRLLGLLQAGPLNQNRSDSHHLRHDLSDYKKPSNHHLGQEQSPMGCSVVTDSPKGDSLTVGSIPPDNELLVSASKTEDQSYTPDSVFTTAETPQMSLNSLCHTLAPMKALPSLQAAHTANSSFLSDSTQLPASPLASKELPQYLGELSPASFVSSSSSSSAHMLPSPATSNLSQVSSVLSPASSVLSPPSSVMSPPSSVMSPASFGTSRAALSMMDLNINSQPTSVSPSPEHFSSDMSASRSHLAEPELLGSCCDSCGCNSESKSIAELYMDKDAVIKRLVEAHETHVMSVFGHLSDEEKQKQQRQHFEECKLHREIFGTLQKLPDHEYDYIYATTGIDADGRQARLKSLSESLENIIRGIVKFSKNIPGFAKVDIANKVNLIKYSRHEFISFTLYNYINYEMKIMRGMDNEWRCEADLIRCFTNPNFSLEMFESHLKFWHSLQKLNLSEKELVLVKAILVMAPDRDPPIDSPAVEEIHWCLVECLIHTLTQRFPDPLHQFAKINDRITESRTQTQAVTEFFKGLGLDKYSNLKDRPLVREMLAGIFFDVKEDELDSYY